MNKLALLACLLGCSLSAEILSFVGSTSQFSGGGAGITTTDFGSFSFPDGATKVDLGNVSNFNIVIFEDFTQNQDYNVELQNLGLEGIAPEVVAVSVPQSALDTFNLTLDSSGRLTSLEGV